jgi:hypothetical protein
VIEVDLQKTGGDGNSLKLLQGKLFTDLRRALATDNVVKYPGDKLRQVLKILRKERRESLRI